jgi:hypothetical protein
MIFNLVENVLTVTFAPEEVAILNWIKSTNSSVDLNTAINSYLIQRKAQMDETQKNDFWARVKDHPEIIDSANNQVDAKVKK